MKQRVNVHAISEMLAARFNCNQDLCTTNLVCAVVTRNSGLAGFLELHRTLSKEHFKVCSQSTTPSLHSSGFVWYYIASNFSLQSHWSADLQPAIWQIKPVSFVSPKYKFYFMITTLIHRVFMTFFNTSCRSWYADSTKCGSSDCAESYFTTPDLTALELDFVTTITHIFFLRGGVPKLFFF